MVQSWCIDMLEWLLNEKWDVRITQLVDDKRVCVTIQSAKSANGVGMPDVHTVARSTFEKAIESAAVAGGWLNRERPEYATATCDDCGAAAHYVCRRCGAPLCYICFMVGGGVCARCGTTVCTDCDNIATTVCRSCSAPLCNDCSDAKDGLCTACEQEGYALSEMDESFTETGEDEDEGEEEWDGWHTVSECARSFYGR